MSSVTFDFTGSRYVVTGASSGMGRQVALELAQAGAVVLPPVISCYSKPESVEKMLHHLTGKILDLFDLEAEDFRRWTGGPCQTRPQGKEECE